MSIISASMINSSTFLLTGFPGLEKYYPLIAIPFSLVYALIFLGNCMVLHVIRTESTLHQPMFYFLALLSFTDLCIGVSTVHTVLGILWGIKQEIHLDACISQGYFIHSLSFTESGVLLAMAFDRFTAICNPLRYNTILTNRRVIQLMVTVVMRSTLTLPPLIRLKLFIYCRPRVLSHSFCLHQDLLRLACSDIRFNSFYALAVVVYILVFDSVLILISYIFILHTVLAIASPEERIKSLQTCVSHLCAVLVFYVPIIGLTMVHRFGKHLSPLVHVLMGNIYILFPPLMNPIIYSVKTKQIRSRMKKWFSLKF